MTAPSGRVDHVGGTRIGWFSSCQTYHTFLQKVLKSGIDDVGLSYGDEICRLKIMGHLQVVKCSSALCRLSRYLPWLHPWILVNHLLV